MHVTQYLKIGSLGKSFGKEGKVRIYVEDSYEHLMDKINHIYVWERGQYVPYFINSIEEKADYLIKFEEIDDIDQIANLSNKEIFISDLQININDYKTDFLIQTNELIGYTIFDRNSGITCEIVDLKEYPSQTMIIGIIKESNETVLIPFVEDWLVGLDNKAKEIVMALPGGLIDSGEEE
jgi:16S rRNA processing protein RimM